MGDGWGVLQPLGITQSMWGSFQLLISLSTKLPLPGQVPRKPGLQLASVMYYNVTFITVTMYIYKTEAYSRTQSLANAFPNLAGSNSPKTLTAAQTYILWFVWLAFYSQWVKWRQFWCKKASCNKALGEEESGGNTDLAIPRQTNGQSRLAYTLW